MKLKVTALEWFTAVSHAIPIMNKRNPNRTSEFNL